MSEPSPIVLVVDDEIQIRRFLRTGFRAQRLRRPRSRHRRRSHPLGNAAADRPGHRRSRPARHGRRRGRRAHPLVVDRADHRAVGARHRGAEGASARDRRRRLRGQAVRHGRIAGARARGVAPADARGKRRAQGHRRSADHRSCHPRGDAQRRAPHAHPQGISAAAGARPARRQRGHPPAPVEGSVGLDPRARHALPAHLRAQAAAEDRAEAGQAAHPGHRTGRRLPAGAVCRRRK